MGNAWASSLLGFIGCGFVPVPFLFYFFGDRIRRSSKHARKNFWIVTRTGPRLQAQAGWSGSYATLFSRLIPRGRILTAKELAAKNPQKIYLGWKYILKHFTTASPLYTSFMFMTILTKLHHRAYLITECFQKCCNHAQIAVVCSHLGDPNPKYYSSGSRKSRLIAHCMTPFLQHSHHNQQRPRSVPILHKGSWDGLPPFWHGIQNPAKGYWRFQRHCIMWGIEYENVNPFSVTPRINLLVRVKSWHPLSDRRTKENSDHISYLLQSIENIQDYRDRSTDWNIFGVLFVTRVYVNTDSLL